MALVGVVNTKHGRAEIHKDPNGIYEVHSKKGNAGKFADFEKARVVARKVAEMQPKKLSIDQSVERKLK